MKYKLTDKTIVVNDRTLYQIEALKDFGSVKKGDKGGFIEKGANLSQYNNCWVYGNARVHGYAEVCGNAEVHGDAEVCGNARVHGYAEVCGYAEVYGDAKVYGYAEVYGDAKVYGNAEVCGNAKVYENAWVCGYAEIYGDAEVYNTIRDYIIFKNNWSSGRHFTWTKSNNMWRVGCFYGTGEELIKKAYEDSEESGKKYEAYVRLVEQLEKL